ncbi:TonB-dependent receptor [Sphingomonas sp. CFBP9019]|uniref:TonB-dependent receptor n=1 Tax=Sphingomonas sp. CFBP9019 TaxID=3096532 RepID=UPI002A6AF5FB|nr:TonB-dependent receptor [Sphingomonas sp. CFBP9019]MDY1010368.1 TonB-dependent receptor [Sphingomonas sp. CFBP9019]
MKIIIGQYGSRLNKVRRSPLIGASSLLAIALATPAYAQAQAQAQTPVAAQPAAPAAGTITTGTAQPAGVQPAVPSPGTQVTAEQAGQPQDPAAAPVPANGQSIATLAPAADEGQEIVVTGLRGSLQRNLDIKRTSQGVVDVISAEDIGKFPDSNVAASLQRLPGVSIQRDGARGDATGITVRGFGGDFNTTLFDGRRVATATGGRQIDFSALSADFIGQLSVLKTPDVSLASSSIGATVDVAFPKPFDHSGLRLATTVSGSLQDRAGRVVPTAGLLISNTFADDTLGILADVVYTRRDTDTNRVFVSGWPGGNYAPCQLTAACTPDQLSTANKTIPGWFPQQYGAEQQQVKDERIDGRIALQWHPSENVMVTLDDNYSRQKITTDLYGFGVWFNQSDLRNLTLDGNSTPTSFTQVGTPTDFQSSLNKRILETNQTGLNVKFDATDNLSFDVDGSYAKSWLNPGNVVGALSSDVGYSGLLSNTTGLSINGNSDKAFPVLTNFGPAGDEAGFTDPTKIGSHVAVRQTQNNTDELKQFRASGTWKQDGLTLKFGGQYYDDTFKLSNKSTFTNNFWQAYAGYGGPSGGTTGISPLPANLLQGRLSLNNFIPGFNGTLPPQVLKVDPVAYQAFLSGLGNPQATNIPGFNYAAVPGFTGSFDEAVDPGSVLRVNEKTWSLFMRANFDVDLAGMPFHFNAGIRNETTNLVATGQGRVPISIVTSAADPTLLTLSFGDTQAVTQKSNYSYLLPTVDMRLEVTDKLQARFSASRTLTRPNLGLLNPVTSAGVGQRVNALSATGGNPNLQPYLADNFDLAGEWYYKRNSYLSVDFFLKNVSNFIVGGVTRQTINGVIDPTTGQPAQFAVSQQINGPAATVRGVEVALQHVFGDTGFGFQANATLVDTNKPYDSSNIAQTGFAVTGLANSANFVGFYDKKGFQFRTALNWRDEYLAGFGQNQNTGSFGSEPTFVNSSFQVDLSSSWDVTSKFSVFGEILNINNNQQSTHGRFKNQLLDVFDYGRRFTLGARFRY